MSRAKKTEERAPRDGATLSIDVDSFVRTRDSVVTGLATLQDAIQTLSTAYIKHTNAVLGEHGAGLDVDAAIQKLSDNPLLKIGGDLQNRAASPPRPALTEAESKKERKKRTHDPNAPKRPLTPFFLYMQTARPIIFSDLGPDAAKGAVAAEGTRRWSTMAQEDKALWTIAYKDNLRLYNARMHSYRHGNTDAKDMTEQEAANYAEENSIGADATADAQLAGEAAANIIIPEDQDAEGEPEKEPTPPPKTPKSSKPTRKAKGSKGATPAETPAEPIVPSSSSIVPPKVTEKEKSPDKKRKRAAAKKGPADEPAAPEKPEAAAEPAKNQSKKKRKSTKSDA